MKSKSKGLLLAILIAFSFLFVNCNVYAEEIKEEEETISEEVTTTGEENKDEVVDSKEEHWTDDISYEKIKDYKIDFDKIFRAIDKEFSKLKNIDFDKVFGNYNSFYEAVNMTKENIIKVVVIILIVTIVLYIIMKIFKIGKK